MTDHTAAAMDAVEQAIEAQPQRPKMIDADRVGKAILAQATARQALHIAEHGLHLANLELIRAEDEVRHNRLVTENNR